MKLQNLSVKRLFGRVAMGLVLSMSGITIALFLVTKQTAVLLTGGALLLCALVGIFVLTQDITYLSFSIYFLLMSFHISVSTPSHVSLSGL